MIIDSKYRVSCYLQENITKDEDMVELIFI